jgi:hypothetical protein
MLLSTAKSLSARCMAATVTGLLAQIFGLITRYRLLARSPRIGKMLLQGFAKLETTHPRTPHWYLFFIGIDAERRGHGPGARFMAPVLQAADGNGMHCYLETPFLQTLPFYHKRADAAIAGQIKGDSMTHSLIGSVAELWRFPVKSMRVKSCKRQRLPRTAAPVEFLVRLIAAAQNDPSHSNRTWAFQCCWLFRYHSRLLSIRRGRR